MQTTEILRTIESAGGTLWADGERLGYRLPEPVLPLVEELRSRKREVLALLAERYSNPSPAHDPAAWAEDFHRWALSRYRFQDRRFSEISVLHIDFCKWQEDRKDVPCTRETFERLLRVAGFFFADGKVYGLVLAEDIKPWCILHPDVLHGEKSDPPDIVPTVDLRRSRTKA